MRVALITISDSAAQGSRPDKSGPALAEQCGKLGWEIVSAEILPDDREKIEKRLSALGDSGSADLILTAGGTGIGPRDSTPEATAAICSKLVPGIGEVMREKGRQGNPRAVLSRAMAGVRGRSLIVNVPGSPRGAVESLDAVAEILPHAVEVLRGARHD
jgi:molybdenum cofactor synthesis domain-containing protein